MNNPAIPNRLSHRVRCLLASIRPATPADTTPHYRVFLPVITCPECEGAGELIDWQGRDRDGADIEEAYPCPHCREGLELDPEFVTCAQADDYLATGRYTIRDEEALEA